MSRGTESDPRKRSKPGGVIRTALLSCAILHGAPASAADAAVPQDLPTVRLSPEVRREALTSPEPVIPLRAISAFLEGTRLISAGEARNAPYYLGGAEGHLLVAPGDTIYARGRWKDGVSVYEILRPARPLVDPLSNEEIALRADPVGEATLLSRDGDQATLRVEDAQRELRGGDVLLPRAANELVTTFVPEAPGFPLEARILEIGDGQVYGGQYDTLILNLGRDDGLVAGHLLRVQRPDNLVEDPNAGETLRFAGERLGSVLIYRVFEQASLALVLESEDAIRLDDRLVSP